jgi:hypothetical protein
MSAAAGLSRCYDAAETGDQTDDGQAAFVLTDRRTAGCGADSGQRRGPRGDLPRALEEAQAREAAARDEVERQTAEWVARPIRRLQSGR